MSIRINLGCGSRPLPGYINVDQDNLDELRKRYPHMQFSDDLVIEDYNIFALPFSDGSIDEVRADGLIEHLSFDEEPLLLSEVSRVLRCGGTFRLEVPDFEAACRFWLEAEDRWLGFIDRSDSAIERQDWFGTNSYGVENRWGYLMATFYGSQSGQGQFHKNAYSHEKLRAMLSHCGFTAVTIEEFKWKGDRDAMLRAVCLKNETFVHRS